MLGPLLALMYLNDLSHQTENEALFYADDTSLYWGTFIRATDSYWPEVVWAKVHNVHEFIRSSSSYCPDDELAKSDQEAQITRDFSRQVWQRFGAPEPPALCSIGTKTLKIQHTRIRVGLATLNAHLFQFQLTPSPACSCGHKHENTAHYMLWCPQYTNHRLIFLNAIRFTVPNIDSLSAKQKLDTLLYGSNLSEAEGIFVTQHLHTYIAQKHRFDTQH